MSQFKQTTVKVTPIGYGKEISFPAERPYRGDLAGYAEFFGGESNLYERIDMLVGRAAEQNGKVKFSKAPEGGWNETNLAEVQAKAQDAIRGYAPDSGGAGVQARAKNVDAFAELAASDASKFKNVDAVDLINRMAGRMSAQDFTNKYGFDAA